MATPPADHTSTSTETDEPELEQTPGGVPQDGAQSSDHPNLVALEKETRRRLEIESTLQDSEARYRLLYDNNPTMYFTLSVDGTVMSVNQFGAAQLGYQPDELIGQSVLKVFKPEEHAAVLGQLEVCTASPLKVFQWEIQKVRKDGSILWVKERAQAVMDYTGKILSLVVCEDITERRLTEDYMRESEERWRALFEHAGVGIAQLAVNGQFLRVNPRLCETLGYSSKTMLRRRCQNFVHPDDLSVAQTHLNELFAGKRPSFSMETRWHRSDDVWLWVEMTVSLVRDATSAPAYFIAVVQSIDDRKQAEAGLARTTQLLQTLVHESPLPIVSLDLEARVTSWNQAATRLFGWTEEEVLGRELPYVPEDEVKDADILWQRGLRGEIHGPVELRRRRKDGEMLDLLLWPVFVQSDKGDVSTAIGLFVDQTDRRQAEEALRVSESAIRELYDITSRRAAPFDQQIRELLDLGRRRFQLPIAAFTTVKGEQLELTAIRSDRPMPAEGSLLPLCNICSRTLNMNSSVALEYVKNSDWGEDCPLLDCETYLGTGLSVGGQRFGTICFMDHAPYPGQFSEADKDFLLLMARWITRELERQNSERALQEQESLLRSVIETATDTIFMKDREGRYRFINTAGALVVGRSPEEIVGRTDSEVLPLQTAQQIMADDRQVFSEGIQKRRVETLFQGEQRAQTFYTVKTPHMDQLGNIVGLVGIARDITDLKRAETELRKSEEALRASEERFSKVFRSSPYPIGITDLESGVCLDINDAALSAFGYSREEVIGQRTSGLGIWSHPQARKQLIERIKTAGNIRNLEVPLKSKSGEVRRFLASTEVIVLKGKECLVTIGTDITEQKRAEEALRRSELAVREAFEERERLSQDLHDNLLQSLYAVGMGLELTRQRIQRISRTNAKRLEQSVGQLNNVIREVRTFISHVQPPVVLEQPVSEALRTLAGSFMATGAGEIGVTVEDEISLRLSAEQRTHLLAIAKEALSNSIRHTKAERRMVTLRRQGNKIRLQVIDNGRGFSPSRRQTQGMGLQNMRARARKLRGRIAITSVLTQGTTVTLTIPLT